MSTTQPSLRSDVDALAEEYFEARVALSPIGLTDLGRDQRQDEYDDFSPAGLHAVAELDRETREKVLAATPTSVADKVTLAALLERLDAGLALHDAGLDLLGINNIVTPVHAIRAVYDQMPTETEEDWHTVCRRLRAVPTALFGWTLSQRAAIDAGHRPARRQVRQLTQQIEQWLAPGGFLDGYRDSATLAGQPLPASLAAALDESIAVARDGFARAANRLRVEFEPAASQRDGVGIDAYRMWSRLYVGADVDLAETYAWGLAEVARLRELERATAQKILPGGTIREAVEQLDADERYLLHGSAALQEWMQLRADEAVEALADRHFDIPDPVRRIECCLAPTHDGGIYYTGPSEDFSRPGRMWWSVPEDVDTFSTWRELTTVYHEGVPGHHLQIAQTVHRRDLLNSWRRLGAWVSAHGEGWALYAEQLMAELGYQDDPGNFLGMLDGQMLRAVRVVIDIGIHCGDEESGDPRFAAPEAVGGGPWTFDKAWAYFNRYVFMDEGFARFEVNRYCGWPGQAPSYKLGERLWMQLREQVRGAKGDAFDLKQFHRTALDLGSMGLGVLSAAVLDLEGVPLER